jgi:hypothetical protein
MLYEVKQKRFLTWIPQMSEAHQGCELRSLTLL